MYKARDNPGELSGCHKRGLVNKRRKNGEGGGEMIRQMGKKGL